jgi:hypothetical protein
MNFYHYSDIKLDILKPQIGVNRHEGEDVNAIGRKVIFLTQDEIMQVEGVPQEYRYTVIIQENDPNLHVDQKHQDLVNSMYETFNIKGNAWHYYTEVLPIHRIEKWDGGKYVTV